MPARPRLGTAIPLSMVGAGVVIAQFVAGKAVRDALFLARFEVTKLPVMVMGASFFSILLSLAMARAMTRTPPARLLPAVFLLSAGLLVLEWSLGAVSPELTAVLFYLHMLGLGPVLVSGFWSVVSERFDPRTAKKRLGQIAGAATLGGVAGSLIADRVTVATSASAMLPVVAFFNVFCAWAVTRLAAVPGGGSSAEAQALLGAPEETGPTVLRAGPVGRSGLRILARVPHLRNLALLILLTTTGATFVDYVFKATAAERFADEAGLLRFFALYYGATSVLSFLVQTSLSRLLLEKLGLAPAAAAPSVALAVGSLGALALPGLPALTAVRGAEFVTRMSFFRAAYELFYTPVPAHEKRAVKPIIDVGCDRTGDMVGGGITRAVLSVVPAGPHVVLLALAAGASAWALVIARRLTRGYVQTLERSLLDQAIHLDLSEVGDFTTRTTMVRTLARPAALRRDLSALEVPRPAEPTPAALDVADPILAQAAALRSRDRERILEVLRAGPYGVDLLLVPHVIRLLAWDPVAPAATDGLKKVAEESVGQLVDALLHPDQDFAIRRRVARVLSVCVSQRAVDGLLLGLDDRFEVRFQCGRSLAAILDRNPLVRVDRDRVFEVVLREVSVSKPVWESHRLLDAFDASDEGLFVDQFIRDRAGQSLAHVFTLLSLVLHREPLQIAFRGLHVHDPQLRGTALEYLESVLPPRVRLRLWPFLEAPRGEVRPRRTRQEILADLVRSNESIMVNLAEIQRRVAEAGDEPGVQEARPANTRSR